GRCVSAHSDRLKRTPDDDGEFMAGCSRRISYPGDDVLAGDRDPAAGGTAIADESYGRTIWPGCSLCTPAATTHSPLRRPAVITAPSSRKRPMVTGRNVTFRASVSYTHTAGLPSCW